MNTWKLALVAVFKVVFTWYEKTTPNVPFSLSKKNIYLLANLDY